MASSVHRSMFALRQGPDPQPPHGAWWPQTRSLSDQLAHLVDHWPIENGHISRILYSRPDWDQTASGAASWSSHPILLTAKRASVSTAPPTMTQGVPNGKAKAARFKTPSLVETSANSEGLQVKNDRLFDTGCGLFFEAALERPLLALNLFLAMQLVSSEPNAADLAAAQRELG